MMTSLNVLPTRRLFDGCRVNLPDLNSSGSGDSGRFKWGTFNNLPESERPGRVIFNHSDSEGSGSVKGEERIIGI